MHAQVQVRADPNDPSGFTWIDASLSMVSEGTIALSAAFGARGTFHKHNVGGGDGSVGSA